MQFYYFFVIAGVTHLFLVSGKRIKFKEKENNKSMQKENDQWLKKEVLNSNYFG